jgi:hypothetical protein
MNFWNKICGFVLLLTFSCLLCGAQRLPSSAIQLRNFSVKKIFYTPVSFNIIIDSFATKRIFLLPPNFITCSYGFFCKEELKVEKTTGLPIHIRLGSLEQCNYYEGKEKDYANFR